MKIIRTYLYITCNKKTLFVKKYLSLLWISPYGPFSLGMPFETCEPFIALTFQTFSGLQLTADTESTDTGVRLYLSPFQSYVTGVKTLSIM